MTAWGGQGGAWEGLYRLYRLEVLQLPAEHGGQPTG